MISFNRRFCLAPMMEYSDRHCRYLWRLISRHAFLYTEMVTSGAILHGDRDRFLKFDHAEHPVALQTGGSTPSELAECTRIAANLGYDEINLNCGCPSDRVQNGMIGAILMRHPEKVADCVKAMQDAASIDVTVKHRIGVDDMEDYAGLVNFVETVANTGCRTFIVHARKAWLQGLSPKENREIPPLDYTMVTRLKADFPELEIIINGGLKTLSQCHPLLNKDDGNLDGVMIGREAYSNPYLLAEVDAQLYGDQHPIPSRMEVAQQYLAYCQQQMEQGDKLHHMSRHMLGLFQGLKGARRFRRHISENIHKNPSIELLQEALELVDFSEDTP
jgi:tRNA-dihydrouridine synthase A